MHRSAAAILFFFACSAATAAAARELLILEAAGVRESGHDLEQLVDDLLLRRGAFSGLALQPSYTAALDYLGIPNAMLLQASAFGTQVVLQIPSTGFSRTFTGTNPADVEDQIEDFFEDEGADELAEFLEETHHRTALAALDGNPRSTTALFARSAFERFGFGAPRTRLGSEGDWGHLELGLGGGGGSVDLDRFESLYVADGALTVGGDLGRVGLYLTALGQYRNYDGADLYDAGLELGVPIALIRPRVGDPWRWVVTPVVQTGGSASRDLLAGGFMVGGGGVSSVGIHLGPVELAVADEFLYYGGVPLGEIGGVPIETELSQWMTRNGVELAICPLGHEHLCVEGGAAATHFLGSEASVDSYFSPFSRVSVKLFDLLRLRLGWESDFGKHDYAAHTGRLDLAFEF